MPSCSMFSWMVQPHWREFSVFVCVTLIFVVYLSETFGTNKLVTRTDAEMVASRVGVVPSMARLLVGCIAVVVAFMPPPVRSHSLRFGIPSRATGRNFPKSPVSPPQLPPKVDVPPSEREYAIPKYPLPPAPTLSPPSTMPFANVDFSKENAFAPPSVKIELAGLQPGDKEPYNSTTGSPYGLMYEAPPLTKAVGSKPIFPQLSGDAVMLRKDSANPYCEYCKAFVDHLKVDGGDDAKAACRRLPLGTHRHCHRVIEAIAKQPVFKRLREEGCVDRTSGMARIRKDCPGLVGCNIVQSTSGSPMCGMVHRSWGTLVRKEEAKDGKKGEGGNPPPLDILETVNPAYAPPPMVGAVGGSSNQYCDACRDIMTQLNKKKDSDGALACSMVPLSQQTGCEAIQERIRRSPITKVMLESGCVDFSGPLGSAVLPVCPPAIACNLLPDVSGGPLCGATLGQYGELKGTADAKL